MTKSRREKKQMIQNYRYQILNITVINIFKKTERKEKIYLKKRISPETNGT